MQNATSHDRGSSNSERELSEMSTMVMSSVEVTLGRSCCSSILCHGDIDLDDENLVNNASGCEGRRRHLASRAGVVSAFRKNSWRCDGGFSCCGGDDTRLRLDVGNGKDTTIVVRHSLGAFGVGKRRNCDGGSLCR